MPLNVAGRRIKQKRQKRERSWGVIQKDSKIPTPAQLIIHYGMGAVLGALLALAMVLTDEGIFQSIVSSSSPSMDMAMFIGVLSFAIGMGASMTGFIFTVVELDALEAKRQTSRVKQRQDPGKSPGSICSGSVAARQGAAWSTRLTYSGNNLSKISAVYSRK
jgi:hypothetical protein